MSAVEKPAVKAAKPASAKAGKPWLTIIAAAVVAAGAAGGGAWFYANRSATEQVQQAEAKAKAGSIPAPAQYFALEPPFVVNLIGSAGGARYLQVEVQLMTRDAESLKSIEQHAPAIRARLLMLFAQENADELISRAGKEKLQAAALSEVRKLLTAETGKPCAEALLFTSFVMQ
ncbi:flagellar basal body-associated FliL family protein [Pseudoxanthomonas wuyuanensis]|uniref:Flagellar protein FliL n=1 Tax=Pseudoxanthomonas wuyuanensis TaxID=1073196 RepID=A0A286CZX7_9GAMM|nr:flagellar basal body-associated FliL family protein [Pseudoxanthomonas wuyuanensis]KAF1722432.1 flagellar basal body protein FliL [Pseudoxanthomonas wuyuanensis]SOD51981.1 flagellar FliL protein [Pseudoxanthomonas wuyuanensis]